MAVNDVSAYIARANRWSFNGVLLEGVQTFSGMTPTGQVSEIDVTDTSSTAMQFEGGLADPGNVSMGVILDPSTDVYEQLRESSENGSIYELRLVVGAKAADSNYTDGAPIQTSLFPATSTTPTGLTAASGKLTVAAAQAGILKAVKKNHYIQSGTNFATSTQITGVTILSSGNVELAHSGSAITLTSGQPVRIVKPAWEIRRLAYVSNFGHDGGVNAAITTPLEFRASGTGNRNVGTPSITI